jgi:hypothetical protein
MDVKNLKGSPVHIEKGVHSTPCQEKINRYWEAGVIDSSGTLKGKFS